MTDPGAEDAVAEAAAVALVAEIVSPGSTAADRAIKPRLYAAAGIPGYLRVEYGGAGVSAVAYALRGGRYAEAARAAAGQRLSLAAPFPVEIDLTALSRRTRPND